MAPDEYANFFNEFLSESDRAAIILGAAQMDELLTILLRKRLIHPKNELFDFNGPFGTFSAKIETAHAIGAIDKSFANKIHLVRRIRNEFAHNIRSVDLDETRTSQQIKELSADFCDTEFWSENLESAGKIYKISGNKLILRFAISLLVANLALAIKTVKTVDGSAAHQVFCPKQNAV
jgi:DNA-binding MltR family transcriptional regulator